MSCQFTWNLNDYKAKEDKGEDIESEIVSAPVILSNVENNTLSELHAQLVINITKTNNEDEDTTCSGKL